MSKINFLCLTAISLTFIACSGKVQTNPLPESKQFVLPKSQVVLTNQVSKHRVDDFDKFLADFFSKRKKVVVVDNIYKNNIDKMNEVLTSKYHSKILDDTDIEYIINKKKDISFIA